MPEFNILNPKNCDFSKIQHHFTQSADQIIDVITYPNGFVMKTITTADKVSVETSKPKLTRQLIRFQIDFRCRNGNCFFRVSDFRFFCFDAHLIFVYFNCTFHSSHSLPICCPDYWTDDVVAFIPEVHQQKSPIRKYYQVLAEQWLFSLS